MRWRACESGRSILGLFPAWPRCRPYAPPSLSRLALPRPPRACGHRPLALHPHCIPLRESRTRATPHGHAARLNTHIAPAVLHYTHTNTWLARPPCSAASCAAPRSREASAAAATCRFAATITTCMPLLLPCLLLAAHMTMLHIAHARPAAAAAHEHAQHAPHTHTRARAKRTPPVFPSSAGLVPCWHQGLI